MPQTTAVDVVLEILRFKGNEWSGKTKLFKAFYFAHLYYAKDRPGLLTDRPIARLPEGPGIDKGTDLLRGMEADGLLTIEIDSEGPYPEYRYALTKRGQEVPRPPAEAREAIRLAADFCYQRTAAELSQITHDKSRSWKHGANGDILNIYIDLIPDEEYHAGEAAIERLSGELAQILNGA